ncbi:MAG: inositol monophosphatase family protein [Gordonia sp. (in: high G+C Gram-positive bacteria)]
MTDLQHALDLPRLLAQAGEVLDAATPDFVAGLGAPGTVAKGGYDFATDVDLSLERAVVDQLQRRTGIEVHGEEFGGPDLATGAAWVLDPIDGTVNYSAGLPIAAMLLALVVDGEPVLGVTRMPLVGRAFAGYVGGGFTVDGEPAEPLADTDLGHAMVGFGSYNLRAGGRYPGAVRADLAGRLSYRAGRLRMSGSAGADAAWVAAGMFGGAISFSRHAWDNAAGAAMVRAAGGLATDLEGRPWTVSSRAMVTGAPGLHEELMAVVGECDWPHRPTEQPDSTDREAQP